MAYKNIFSLISNEKCQLKLPGDTFMRFSKIKMSDAPSLFVTVGMESYPPLGVWADWEMGIN